MLERIEANVTRQEKALSLLNMLQEEEFSLLGKFDPQEVSALSLSIQELIRQILVERTELRNFVRQLDPERRLKDILAGREDEQALRILGRLELLGKLEQVCARAAERNQLMAAGLLSQATGYIKFFQDSLTPKEETYSADGRFSQRKRSSAAVMHNNM